MPITATKIPITGSFTLFVINSPGKIIINHVLICFYLQIKDILKQNLDLVANDNVKEYILREQFLLELE